MKKGPLGYKIELPGYAHGQELYLERLKVDLGQLTNTISERQVSCSIKYQATEVDEQRIPYCEIANIKNDGLLVYFAKDFPIDSIFDIDLCNVLTPTSFNGKGISAEFQHMIATPRQFPTGDAKGNWTYTYPDYATFMSTKEDSLWPNDLISVAIRKNFKLTKRFNLQGSVGRFHFEFKLTRTDMDENYAMILEFPKYYRELLGDKLICKMGEYQVYCENKGAQTVHLLGPQKKLRRGNILEFEIYGIDFVTIAEADVKNIFAAIVKTDAIDTYLEAAVYIDTKVLNPMKSLFVDSFQVTNPFIRENSDYVFHIKTIGSFIIADANQRFVGVTFPDEHYL